MVLHKHTKPENLQSGLKGIFSLLCTLHWKVYKHQCLTEKQSLMSPKLHTPLIKRLAFK